MIGSNRNKGRNSEIPCPCCTHYINKKKQEKRAIRAKEKRQFLRENS